MTGDAEEFLDRCEDVLTNWHTSGDAMHCARGEPVDPPLTFTFRYERPRVPVRAEVEWDAEAAPSTPYRSVPVVPDVDREAFVAMAEVMRATFRDLGDVLRPVADACQDTFRHVGVALHQCHEGAKLAGLIVDDPAPTDPRERALWLQQHRNTGPQLHRLDGRRR